MMVWEIFRFCTDSSAGLPEVGPVCQYWSTKRFSWDPQMFEANN